MKGLSDLPKWMLKADSELVAFSRQRLESTLRKKFGDDNKAKLNALQRLVEHFKNGHFPKDMSQEDCVALFQVYNDLLLNQKMRGGTC